MLSFATERRVVVEVEQIEPRGDIRARDRDRFVRVVEKLAALDIARRAILHESRPERDFVRTAFGAGIFAHPIEEVAITESGVDLLFESLRVDGNEFEKFHVEWTTIVVFAVAACGNGAAFVYDARQDYESAQAATRAAGRTAGEVGRRSDL